MDSGSDMVTNSNPFSTLQEEWIRWEPIKGLSARYYIDSINDSGDTFKIVLSDADEFKKKVCITFIDSVRFYQKVEESLIFKRLDSLYERYGNNDCIKWTFFKVINSNYLRLLYDQSYETASIDFLTHFSLHAVNDMVDIINPCEPKVEFFEDHD